MAKSSLEKALEKHQKEIERQFKKKIYAEKKLANKQRQDSERQAKINARRERASSIVGGQPTVGDIRILDNSAEELVSLICKGYCRNDYRVTNNDIEIPVYLENDLALEFEKLKQYGLISNYGYYISGCWEITILPGLLTYFERKESAILQEKQNYNTNHFYGDVTGVQIQQGTVNSSQTQSITQDFDYGAISDILENIKKYDSLLDDEFGDKASDLREKIVELEELIEKRENPSKVKILLAELKNLAIGVSGSLIASGIAAQIPLFQGGVQLKGIVIELEKEALNEKASVESLLRKAYLVARKLKLEEFEEWINNEQNGYKGNAPDYRMINGEYKAWNPYRGWIPVILSPKLGEFASRILLNQSVSALREIYTSHENSIQFTLNTKMNALLNQSTDGFETRFVFETSRSEIYRILSTVRNKILEWALFLEENEIIGEGMTFTDEEKKKAQEIKIINNYTNNFYSDVSDIEMKQG